MGSTAGHQEEVIVVLVDDDVGGSVTGPALLVAAAAWRRARATAAPSHTIWGTYLLNNRKEKENLTNS